MCRCQNGWSELLLTTRKIVHSRTLLNIHIWYCSVAVQWVDISSKPTPQPFYGPFLGPPGWASARRELLDFMVQGKINRGRHTNHPDGLHSIQINQCPPPPSPHIFTGRMLFLPSNQKRQSTEGISSKGRCYKSVVIIVDMFYQRLLLLLLLDFWNWFNPTSRGWQPSQHAEGHCRHCQGRQVRHISQDAIST